MRLPTRWGSRSRCVTTSWMWNQAPPRLGKTAGKDAAQSKSTYPALLGMDGAKSKLAELASHMQELLLPYGEPGVTLASLGRFAVDRAH